MKSSADPFSPVKIAPNDSMYSENPNLTNVHE
jgi:hypothetical protein